MLVNVGKRFVSPLNRLVNGRKRFVNPAVTLLPVKMLVRPRFVGGNGFVPAKGVGEESGGL